MEPSWARRWAATSPLSGALASSGFTLIREPSAPPPATLFAYLRSRQLREQLDVFDTQREIQVCTGYTHKGAPIREMPALVERLAEATPVYKTLPGWCSATYGIRDAAQLPLAARDYLKFIADELSAEIGMISTGPERDATIVPSGTKLASWL